MATTSAVRTPRRGPSQDTMTREVVWWQKAGGAAALYISLALLAAIPYFLLVVDYPGATTGEDKVALIVDHYPSLVAMYMASYVAFGIAVGVVALALWDRLHFSASSAARAATGVGALWSVALVASGLVFTYGMTVINELAATDRAQAVATWGAIETVALALGGAGGELLGGLWLLSVGLVILRSGVLPKALGWLGAGIGVVGLASVVPALHEISVAFGLGAIVWFAWLSVMLLRRPAMRETPS